MTAADIAAALHARHAGPGRWRTAAVCHGGDANSAGLAIATGRDGRPLFHCWTRQCDYAKIAAAVEREIGRRLGPMQRRAFPADHRRRAAADRRRDRLGAEARALAGLIRRLGAVELLAADRVRDIRAGAPERMRGELWFAAQAAAEAAGDVARLTAKHETLLRALYPSGGRGGTMARSAA